MILAPSEVGVILGVLVTGVGFLPNREVAALLVMHARVAGLLTLREVTTVVLLGSVAFFLLTLGEGGVLFVVVAMLGVIVVVMVMRAVMTMIIVGMFAHARVLPARLVRPIVTCRSSAWRVFSARGGAAAQQTQPDLNCKHD
ncbi:MAG: hypothetical protein ACR2GO_05985 [Candidatus Limnocylindria bacterium]